MENKAIHRLDDHDTPNADFSLGKFVGMLAIIIVVGILSGLALAKLKKSPSTTTSDQKTTTEKSAGIVDKKTFKDNAEGILREGGIDGEGNFHLERPGGESQTAYLTSSTVDLTQYIGKKVRVWGQTFKGEKAGWLMDVGLVENLN